MEWAQSQPSLALALGFSAGFLIALIFVGLIGGGPLRLFAPIARLLALPLRPFIFLLRLVRILPKASGRIRAARNAALGAAAVSKQGVGHETEVDAALSEADEAAEGDDAPPAPYSFKEEAQHLKRDGVVFRSIQIRANFFPAILTAALTDEIADSYVKEAQKFFNRQVALTVNSRALYEDAEGAFIISLFRRNDRRCYYILNEMRKTINGNARRLVLLFSLLLAGVFAAELILPAEAFATKLALCAATVALMFIWHNAGYQKQQQHNVRELRSFLTRYLGRISDRYREATGIARGVTVGDETDSKKLSEAARKWHKIMIWMPFRTFFIECFVRNVLYQINRNCTYYLYIVPLTLLLIAGAAVLAVETHWIALADFTTIEGAALIVGFLFVALFYVERINKVVIAEELDQLDWLGYDNLNVSAAMDDVVGKYAEDVGFWKGRLDR